VKIYRRKLPRSARGKPGSEVDVLARVPAIGSVQGDPIAVPVEVKLSGNPEARTGLRNQLGQRYMGELGTTVGVFVVVWMDAPKLTKSHRPKWKSRTAAVAELREQAKAFTADSGGTMTIEPVVIDASPMLAPESTTKPKRGRSGSATQHRQKAKGANGPGKVGSRGQPRAGTGAAKSKLGAATSVGGKSGKETSKAAPAGNNKQKKSGRSGRQQRS
jgi:hypothetical protein